MLKRLVFFKSLHDLRAQAPVHIEPYLVVTRGEHLPQAIEMLEGALPCTVYCAAGLLHGWQVNTPPEACSAVAVEFLGEGWTPSQRKVGRARLTNVVWMTEPV